MKKIVIVLVVAAAALAVNCKKKEKDPEPEPVKEQTYCVYESYKGTKVFYKCASGKAAADAAYTELTNQGKDAIAEAKNSCSECQ